MIGRVSWVPLVAVAVLLAGCAGDGGQGSGVTMGLRLVERGLAEGGRSVLALGKGGAGCWEVVRLAEEGGVLARLEGPAGAAPCGPIGAAAGGPRLVLHDYDRGRLDILAAGGAGIAVVGELALPGKAGFPNPVPGRNLALTDDGRQLLVGAVERGCRTVVGQSLCGQAFLFQGGPAGWEIAATLNRPAQDMSSRFGQTIVLLADGAVLVGGTGNGSGPGRLHLFVPGTAGYEHRQSLAGSGEDSFFFATDAAASGDGRWIAVGEAQAVSLWSRDQGGLRRMALLQPPDDTAGYFGQAVALDRDGATLVVGAPGSVCQEGASCGRAYVYERSGTAWRLAHELRRRPERKVTSFGQIVAVSADGEAVAIQGDAITIRRF